MELRFEIHPVPVHIHRGNGQRDVLAGEFEHQIFVFRLAVWVITAPPISQRKARHQRDAARNGKQRAYRADIVIAEGEHIHVPFICGALCDHAVLVKQQRLTVIKQRNAVGRQNAIL